MERKHISFILSILTILALASVSVCAVNLYYEMPMNVTIQKTASVNLYVGGNPWTNNTSVGWNTMAPGETETKSLEVKNTGNLAVQITATPSGLPSGWDLTYSRNGSIVQPDQWLNGTLTLTTASDSPEASYFWVLGIQAS